jgi:hypothetical protein
MTSVIYFQPFCTDTVGSVSFHPLEPKLLSVSGSRHFEDDYSDDSSSESSNEGHVVLTKRTASQLDSTIKSWSFKGRPSTSWKVDVLGFVYATRLLLLWIQKRRDTPCLYRGNVDFLSCDRVSSYKSSCTGFHTKKDATDVIIQSAKPEDAPQVTCRRDYSEKR